MSGFHPRRRSARTSVASIVVLMILWAMLWGDLGFGTLAAGVLVATFVVLALPMARIGFAGTIRPWWVLVLLVRFHFDLVRASWQVGILAFRWHYTPRGAIIGVKLRRANDLTMTSVAQISALVPGTVVVDAHRLTGTLYLHVLDIDVAGGPEAVRSEVLALEARVLRALGPRKDLIELGLRKPRRTNRSGRLTDSRTSEVGPS